MSLLDTIATPADIRDFEPEDRVALIRELRERISQVVSDNGGHFGANLGVVELTVALHTVFESPTDRIVWDTSHQCYAHKLLTGRADAFHTLRTYGGISGFCHKGESPHDIAFAGHAGTAASIALGIAQGVDLEGSQRRTIGVVGDASLVSGMTLEALNNAGWFRPRVLLIFNDNGMSIDYPTGGLHASLQAMRPWVSAPERERLGCGEDEIAARKEAGRGGACDRVRTFFEALGVAYRGPVDGHDVELLIETLRELEGDQGPTLLHIHTRKGAGWGPALADPVAWHAAKGFLEPRQPAAPKARSWTVAFGDALCELAREDERVVAITAAMPGGTGLKGFRKEFEERTFDVGICEQHGAGFASGLSVAGRRPVFAVYSTFLQRAFDQVVHDVAIQENPMVFALDRAGLVGVDGVTHQGLFDISYLRCIPGLVLLAPADEAELRSMLRWALNSQRIVALRWPRDDVPTLGLTGEPIEMGRGRRLAAGDGSVAVFAYGAMVAIALEARELLAAEGVSVAVADARFAKPIDVDLLCELLVEHAVVLTAEDHALAGGFGSACLEAVARKAPERLAGLRCAGVGDAFVHHGARELQLRDAGLDAAGLAGRVREHLGHLSATVR